MQRFHFTGELNRLSIAGLQRNDDLRCFCQKMTVETIVTPLFHELAIAVNVGAEKPEAKDVLPTFFDEEALPLMLQLPNLYWFWKVVNLITIISLNTGSGPYNRDDVIEAVSVLRSTASQGKPLKRLGQLTADLNGSRESQIGKHTALGLLVLVPSADGSTHWLVDNPVYFATCFNS